MPEAAHERQPDAADEDLRLIERVLSGDRHAFEALVVDIEQTSLVCCECHCPPGRAGIGGCEKAVPLGEAGYAGGVDD